MTPEDQKAKAEVEELSEEELDKVAGGVGGGKYPVTDKAPKPQPAPPDPNPRGAQACE